MFYTLQKNKLNKILEKHKMWLIDNALGERADLRNADLRNADLCGADLAEADLYGADLRGAYLGMACFNEANLFRANLSRAYLSGTEFFNANLNEAKLHRADICRADLCEANFFKAKLFEADLRGVNLYGANLQEADLGGADLQEADLGGADLCGADLTGASLGDAHLGGAYIDYPIACPEKGSFIGYKKANGLIVELQILDTAMRCSATSRKCRCSEAKVISITTLGGDYTDITEVFSDFDNNFIYKVGEIVKVENFDTNRWKECSSGIHFFITRDEAVDY